MERNHDTLIDLHLDTPGWFTALAWILPAAIFSQFVSAGLGLFHAPDMLGVHTSVGFAVSLPVIGLAAGAILLPRLRGFGWWAGLVFLLYLGQVALAAGGAPLPLALHPANGALMLAASIVLLAKVERRRRAAQSATPDRPA